MRAEGVAFPDQLPLVQDESLEEEPVRVDINDLGADEVPDADLPNELQENQIDAG